MANPPPPSRPFLLSALPPVSGRTAGGPGLRSRGGRRGGRRGGVGRRKNSAPGAVRARPGGAARGAGFRGLAVLSVFVFAPAAEAQTAPAVSSVSIAGSPVSGDTYGAGETIAVEVGFQIPVTVTGTPRLALTIGTGTGQAGYASGSGTQTLTFRYTVLATDADADGIAIGASALAFGGGTIRSAAMIDAVLGLGAHALTNQADHKVNGAATAPAVSSVAISSRPASGDTYGAAETIAVEVGFQIPVTVTGTPRLALTIGTGTGQAGYASGSGTQTLTFRYTVLATDADADGIAIGASALAFGGGTIRSAAMIDAVLGLGAHALTNQADHKVNGAATAPAVSSVAISSRPASGDTYGAAETIAVEVGFQIPVTVTGTPRLALTIGTGTGQAGYASGSGTRTLTFRYTVLATDADADGIAIGASALALGGGTIRSAAMTNAALGLGTHALTNQADHKVNGPATAPRSPSDGVRVSSSPASGDVYGAGETIAVEVRFQIPVTVTGTPQLALTIGAATAQAAYASGSGTTALTFRYTVQAADLDVAGISVGTSALSLNGGTMRSGNGVNANLSVGGFPTAGGHKVDGARAAVSQVSLTSSPVSGDTYGAGERIAVAVGFSTAVTVTGTPRLALTIGAATAQAAYASGSGTTALTFHYTVQAADRDSDGIGVSAGALGLNGGTILNGNRTAAALGLGVNAISAAAAHKVDGSTAPAPAVNSVSIASSPAIGDTYGRGETIDVQVGFRIPVRVTGAPRVSLAVGTGSRSAAYAGGSGTTALTFSYTVAVGDLDVDGIGVGAGALSLAGGTIRSAAGTNALLGLGTHTIANDSSHKVDGSRGPPDVTGLTIGSPAAGDTFERGERIEVTLTFRSAVDVTGTPRLALGVGTQTRQASYVSGTGTASLVFRYTVASSDADADGISIAAGALTLNGGTIRAAGATLDAALGLGPNAVSNSTGHKVAGGTFTAAAVSQVSITDFPVGGTYRLGDEITVRVTFARRVAVTGSPQLALTIGTATRQAAWVSGARMATALTFSYTVVAGDADADGISVAADALTLNGGRIDDARDAMAAASLALGANAISNSALHKVDSTQGPPGVQGVALNSPAADGTFERGERIEVTVTFNKAVDVTGTPRLALGVGTATRQASYASGTGTAALVFRYTVVSGDADADGISIAAGALTLNGGTIDVSGGTTDAVLGLGAHAVSNSAGHKVAGATFTAPSVSGVSITSTPASGDTYGLDERIEAQVTFVRPVTVTGSPRLALTIGTQTRQASYVSGTGTASLVFRYTVVAADADTDGISVGAGALTLNGGEIDDARDTTAAASLGLGANAISNSANHKVDGVLGPPIVTGLAIGSPVAGDTFERGERIEATVTFNKAVDVTGTPRLALIIGAATRQASYASGTGTASLVFRYTVVAGDADTNGISVPARALTVAGGATVREAGGSTDAMRGLGAHAVSNSAGHKVAGGTFTASSVSGASITSTPSGGDTYGLGARIEVQVTFTRPVTVTGSPRLALTIGTQTRQASYASGTGTASLTFRYTVVAADADTDGISVGASALTLNGGEIDDARDSTAAASLGLGANAISDDANHKVDGAQGPPGVQGVALNSPAAGDTFERDEQVEVTVTFNHAVTVTGTPRLALAIGAATRQASYVSGTGTTSLVFRYTVVAADADTDGISVGAGALTLNGGEIDDARDATVAASLGLGANAISDSANHKVDGGAQRPPRVQGVALNSPAVGDTFERGERIEVTVTFNKAVDVTGTPRLALYMGAQTRDASWAAGTGTASLVFRYTVAAGDTDADGISIPATGLTLAGGTIRVAGGTTDAVLRLGVHAVSNSAGHKVAGGTFTASSVSGASITSTPASGDTYGLGERITVQVTFTRPVTVTGSPRLALTIGAATRQASYVSGTGTASLVFRYTVASGDADADGISVGASALTLNGGEIDDARDTTAAASLGLGANAIADDANHKVNGAQGPPRVQGVALNSPAAGDTFERGERIEVTVTFYKAVDVTGTPRLALGVGAATRQASYASGTGTASLVFRYTVASGDTDADGISIAAGALTLNGGTIDEAGGTTDAVLGLGTHAVSNSAGHKVAGGTFTASSVNGASITSTPAGGATYGLGERIEVQVTFNKAVTVTGTPRLALTIGAATRQASYASGASTATVLAFRYTVVAGDADANGISVGASALTLNGGEIDDARDSTAAASLGLGTNAISDDASHKVDGAQGPPGVTGLVLNSPAAGDTFERGERIEVTVTFNKAVDVTGSPRLALGVGTATRQASYASGTGTASLVFRYTVASGDADADGISIAAGALTLNGGTIDVSGGTTDAVLGLGTHAVSNSAGHKVAGGTFTASSVSGASITSTPAGGATYGLGERIEVQVTFARPVTVTGSPRLALTIGTQTRQASYVSGTGTASLVFRYTVVVGDADTDGISVGAGALTLNGGEIDDARDSTAAASLGLGANAISNSANHKVDGAQGPPGVTGLVLNSPAAGDTFERGERIEVTVTFNKAVDVTGTPRLALGVGAATPDASYVSGTGTASLVFRHTVVATDTDADGISVGADALTLNGGTIRVSGGTTDAVLGLGAHAVSNSAGHKVAGGTFTASSVNGASITSTPAGGAAYGLGERIEVQVTFVRPVTVTGTPRLALTIGAATRQASYVSGASTATVLAFRYTVVAGDADADGISVGASALTLNGGEIDDARDSTAAASLGLGANAISDDANHKVDGAQGPPGVTGVAIGAPAAGDTFERGERIEVTVTFNKAVDVTGSPRLALGVGTATPDASYVSGTGTASLVFRHTVVATDTDADGISVGADALTLNGGTIDVAGGTTDAVLGLGTHAVSNSAGHKVAGGTFTASSVNGASITSTPAGGATYGLGERIEVQVTFARPVTVTGTPRLALTIGTQTRQASYVSGTGTAALVFRYTVVAADADTDGISVGAGALTLNGGAIDDARDSTAAASLGLGANAISNSANHKVDGVLGPPVVTGLAIGSPVAGDTFERGERIEVTVTFNKAVDVTGTPRLALGVGTATRQASYASGTGTAALVFRYTVASGDADADGISIAAGALTLNGGTIDEAGGTTDALLGLGVHAVSNSAGHKVAGAGGGGGGGGGSAVVENEAPSFVSGSFAFSLAENAAGPLALGVAAASDPDAGDTLTYRLEAGDAARFAVDAATGEVRYVGVGEDYESSGPGTWELVVSATDASGASARATVTVTLTNVDEAPVFTRASYEWELAENVAGPVVLGTMRATGPGGRLSYALVEGDASRFAVDAASGRVRYVGAGEDAETGPDSWTLVVSATDASGASARATVTVTLTNADEAPVFTRASYEWELAENVAGPVVLGLAEAVDSDRGDTRRYRLGGADAERFAVDAETGEVRYVGAGEDAETGPASYAFTVVVTDGAGLSASAPVAVRVLDVNEAPVFAESAYAFDLAENAAGAAGAGRRVGVGRGRGRHAVVQPGVRRRVAVRGGRGGRSAVRGRGRGLRGRAGAFRAGGAGRRRGGADRRGGRGGGVAGRERGAGSGRGPGAGGAGGGRSGGGERPGGVLPGPGRRCAGLRGVVVGARGGAGVGVGVGAAVDRAAGDRGGGGHGDGAGRGRPGGGAAGARGGGGVEVGAGAGAGAVAGGVRAHAGRGDGGGGRRPAGRGVERAGAFARAGRRQFDWLRRRRRRRGVRRGGAGAGRVESAGRSVVGAAGRSRSRRRPRRDARCGGAAVRGRPGRSRGLGRVRRRRRLLAGPCGGRGRTPARRRRVQPGVRAGSAFPELVPTVVRRGRGLGRRPFPRRLDAVGPGRRGRVRGRPGRRLHAGGPDALALRGTGLPVRLGPSVGAGRVAQPHGVRLHGTDRRRGHGGRPADQFLPVPALVAPEGPGGMGSGGGRPRRRRSGGGGRRPVQRRPRHAHDGGGRAPGARRPPGAEGGRVRGAHPVGGSGRTGRRHGRRLAAAAGAGVDGAVDGGRRRGAPSARRAGRPVRSGRRGDGHGSGGGRRSRVHPPGHGFERGRPGPHAAGPRGGGLPGVGRGHRGPPAARSGAGRLVVRAGAVVG